MGGQPQLLRGNAWDEAGWENLSHPCNLWKTLTRLPSLPLRQARSWEHGEEILRLHCNCRSPKPPPLPSTAAVGEEPAAASSPWRPGRRSAAEAGSARSRDPPRPEGECRCPLPASAGRLPSGSLKDTLSGGSEGPMPGADPCHAAPSARPAGRHSPAAARRHSSAPSSSACRGAAARSIPAGVRELRQAAAARLYGAGQREAGLRPRPRGRPAGARGRSAAEALGHRRVEQAPRGIFEESEGRGAEGRACPAGSRRGPASPGAGPPGREGTPGREGPPGHACGPCLPACLVSPGTCSIPPFSSGSTGETGPRWITSFIHCKPLAGCRGAPQLGSGCSVGQPVMQKWCWVNQLRSCTS